MKQNFYAWGQVLAISDGDVIFANASFRTTSAPPRTQTPLGEPLVIHNKQDFYHLYAHFQHNKVFVSAGDTVAAGTKLGLLGNSGGSSEPHLHLGISKRDGEGCLRSLPMTFSKIKNGQGSVVTGVPVDGEFYS